MFTIWSAEVVSDVNECKISFILLTTNFWQRSTKETTWELLKEQIHGTSETLKNPKKLIKNRKKVFACIFADNSRYQSYQSLFNCKWNDGKFRILAGLIRKNSKAKPKLPIFRFREEQKMQKKSYPKLFWRFNCPITTLIKCDVCDHLIICSRSTRMDIETSTYISV